ncbi:hypothetical protein LGR54_12965 [Ancylobacter sp. Lp-2]|uniref:hypothetical protein n=1 Tax=Ancylobacter sp. Lp-2 TaxID=2881339 RepID=UPI001E306480|nr:hypothetical protein [Ancylobacter sp. Lp-2]MCB4769522.1 hypothetical protein [Ancylobacter sp. Lp-2]
MATTSCRHCGYQPVADNAPLCPTCGGRQPGRRWWHGPLGLVVLAAVALIGYWLVF